MVVPASSSAVDRGTPASAGVPVKLFRCDGRELEVRDVGAAPVVYRLTAAAFPLKPAGGYRLLDDDRARDELRALRAMGLYDGGAVSSNDG